MSRPHEHRVRLTAHVLTKTKQRVEKLVKKKHRERSTIGRIIDTHFGKVKDV